MKSKVPVPRETRRFFSSFLYPPTGGRKLAAGRLEPPRVGFEPPAGGLMPPGVRLEPPTMELGRVGAGDRAKLVRLSNDRFLASRLRFRPAAPPPRAVWYSPNPLSGAATSPGRAERAAPALEHRRSGMEAREGPLAASSSSRSGRLERGFMSPWWRGWVVTRCPAPPSSSPSSSWLLSVSLAYSVLYLG